MKEKFNCGNGCPLGGADDCFWWKGHESCEHYKKLKVKLPKTEKEFQMALHNAYLAGAYTEKSGTFKFWYDENYK